MIVVEIALRSAFECASHLDSLVVWFRAKRLPRPKSAGSQPLLIYRMVAGGAAEVDSFGLASSANNSLSSFRL